MREPLELETELHRVARGGELPRVLWELLAPFLGQPDEPGLQRIDDPPVELGEPRQQVGVPQHVGPELEEHREPAVAALGAGGRRPGRLGETLGCGRGGLEDGLELPPALLEPALVGGEEEVLLRLEVRVDRSLGVARLGGHGIDRGRVEALAREQPLGRINQLRARASLALGTGRHDSHTASIQMVWVSVKSPTDPGCSPPEVGCVVRLMWS